MNTFNDDEFGLDILSELVGDSLVTFTRLFEILLMFELPFSETGVVATSQSFPPNELFKLMFATSLSLEVFELLMLELVFSVFGC